jgi:serine acetyltransferase
VPKRKNTFSSWRRGLVQRAVHTCWSWAQHAGSVTAENPGRFRFGSIGEATRLAFPLGTVFGEPWIHLGSHCIIGEQVTLTAGLMPDLDLGPDPILRIGDGVVLGRGSHVIADTTVTIGSDCYFGPYVYVTSTNHSYDDPHEPIGKQWPRMEPVEIGPGCWIGTVPDHAVVAGAPARVVRRWTPDDGWQPPLGTPAPVPIPEGTTPDQLRALERRGLAGSLLERAKRQPLTVAARRSSAVRASGGPGGGEAPDGIVPQGDPGGDALADRLPSYLEALGDGHHDLQTVLAHPARVGGPGHRQDGIAVPDLQLHRPARDPDPQEHRAGCVLTGVGDQFADHQLRQMHRARRHRRPVDRLYPGEKGSRPVAGLGDASAVVAVELDREVRRLVVRRHGPLVEGARFSSDMLRHPVHACACTRVRAPHACRSRTRRVRCGTGGR